MSKHQITDESFLKQVKSWIESDNLIYVDVYIFHAPFSYLISSFEDFKELIVTMKGRGELTVVRHPDFLINGIVNSSLLEEAIKLLSENKELTIRGISSNDKNIQVSFQEELKDIFKNLNGKSILIWNDNDGFPPDRPPRNKEEVFTATFR